MAPMAGVTIFRAELVGALHPLRFTVYNLCGVIADLKSVGSLVDLSALVPVASVTILLEDGCVLIAHYTPIAGQSA
jgi:hypothetical protein